jgi:hypothetical protein
MALKLTEVCRGGRQEEDAAGKGPESCSARSPGGAGCGQRRGGRYSFSSDAFALDTDCGLFSNSNAQPARVTAGAQRIVYHFAFGPRDAHGSSGIRADLIYSLGDGNGFFRRALIVADRRNKRPF